MKLIIQRVKKAHVSVNKRIVGKIDEGLLILVGFTYNDTSKDIDTLVNKIVNLRIFDDEKGIMNRSLLDVSGSILSISQFTLYADTSNGRRPSYANALKGEDAIILYDEFNNKLKQFVKVETGIFGADMQINMINNGPVTIILESRSKDDKK